MYLGIDIGGTYCKAVIIDKDNNLLYTARNKMPNPIKTNNSQIVEYDS